MLGRVLRNAQFGRSQRCVLCYCTSTSGDPSTELKNTASESSAEVSTQLTTEQICSRELLYPPKPGDMKVQSWVSTMSRLQDHKIGIIDLHPTVFASPPRVDIVHENIDWQLKYKKINYTRVKTRAEMSGGGRKPWPQKGTGRARHGSIRSPLWKGGGAAKGPRGPLSYFYNLAFGVRVLGLTTTLSMKFAQNSLFVVDSLDIPTEDPEYMRDLVKSRDWGLSVLFVDDADEMPQNIANSLSKVPEYNAMSVLGLNVHSMVKHEAVVLTLPAVNKIEERILYHYHKPGVMQIKYKKGDHDPL